MFHECKMTERIAPSFGISTHLFHAERLTGDHLSRIAASGFDAVEVFATRTHVDYHDKATVEHLVRWLREAGLRLHSIHAPIVLSLINGQWGPPFSNATGDDAERLRAIQETAAALNLACDTGAQYLVVHLGVPTAQKPAPNDNQRDAARRSIEQIHALADPLGVQVALEVIPNGLSTAASLVSFIEDELDLPRLGICIDFGHAQLLGDPVEAVETASGHIVTTHIHDNRGTSDDHLMPFDGVIDWTAALMSLQKVGYESTFMFEVANHSTPDEMLQGAARVRRRFEAILAQ
jgi:sugar phosphate isomerase/epimerase